MKDCIYVVQEINAFERHVFTAKFSYNNQTEIAKYETLTKA